MFKKYLWNFFWGIFLAEYICGIHDQVNSIGGFAWAIWNLWCVQERQVHLYAWKPWGDEHPFLGVHIGVHEGSKRVKKYQNR